MTPFILLERESTLQTLTFSVDNLSEEIYYYLVTLDDLEPQYQGFYYSTDKRVGASFQYFHLKSVEI